MQRDLLTKFLGAKQINDEWKQLVPLDAAAAGEVSCLQVGTDAGAEVNKTNSQAPSSVLNNNASSCYRAMCLLADHVVHAHCRQFRDSPSIRLIQFTCVYIDQLYMIQRSIEIDRLINSLKARKCRCLSTSKLNMEPMILEPMRSRISFYLVRYQF